MAEPVSLLPDPTPWELSHELTDAKRWSLLDPQWIVQQTDPMTCDPSMLPVIAWGRSVDLWYEDWSLEKRRYVAANWYAYERLKGKAEGFRRFYSLVGVKLLKVTAPPQGVYPKRGWTDEERQRYLAQFQQIRIYPKVPVREFQRGFFVASAARSKAFVGRVAPTAHKVTIDTVVREARLYDPTTGQETGLTRREVVSQTVHFGQAYRFEDIILPAKDGGFYVGDHLRNRYLRGERAPERVIRTEIQRPYGVAVSRPQWSSVVPNGRLISIKPDLIRERFQDRGAFIGRASTGKRTAIYPKRDKAWQHVYERFYLYDRARDKGVSAGERGSYVGRCYLGMTPYTARMKVEIRGKRKTQEFRVGRPPGLYLKAEDRKILDRALEATRAAKSLRDTIFLQTQTRRNRRFGDRMTFGDRIIFGAKVET